MPSPSPHPGNALQPRQFPRRILVVRYRFIGDTLLTVPFLRNLRRAYPDAIIDVLVGPNSGEVLAQCPYINELIYFDTTRKHRYENTAREKPKTFWSYVQKLRDKKYDAAFILKRSFSSALLCFLAGIPERIGFDTEFRRWLLTQPVPYRDGQHEVDCFLDLLNAYDVPATDRHLESWWSDAEEQAVNSLLSSVSGTETGASLEDIPEATAGGNYLLHITSGNPAKEWTLENFSELARWLIEEKKASVHCLGAASDLPGYQALRSLLPDSARQRFYAWCGQTTLLESLAFLKRMNGVIGVDSGTLHMAAAVGTPVIALFGPMDEKRWMPLGEKNIAVTQDIYCRPCNLKTPCHEDYRCMKELPVEKVKALCETRLNF